MSEISAKTVTGLEPPRHVAIIMDGNGRWAKARGLPRVAGHKGGADAVRRIVEGCRELGVGYLTLFAFSSENWKRPAAEIDDLMGLLRVYLVRELEELDRNGVRVRFLGGRHMLADDIVALIEQAENRTRRNATLVLQVAVNYGGRWEIARAARRIAEDVRDGQLNAVDIDEETFGAYLQTGSEPDPDLIIRTSGEQRLSNFLLWQAAYSELIFVNQLWPDFNKESLIEAIREYHRRERRYGAAVG